MTVRRLLIGCLVFAAACRARTAPKQEPDAAPAAAGTKDRAGTVLYPVTPGSFARLVADARASVVAVRAGAPVKAGPAAMFPGTPESQTDVALGTGFLIDHGGTLYVLTSNRVAKAAKELSVVLTDGRDAPIRFVGGDDKLDVAMFAIDLPRLEALRLGNSDDLDVGEWIVVLGNPFGDEVTASAGVVSATGRNAAGAIIKSTASGFRSFLQLDARIHRGNAGGPVIDEAGQVVGVAVATGDRPGELAFAAPINRIKEILDPLRDYGAVARSWFGVVVRPVTDELAAQAGLAKPTGALVTEVVLGSPAALAGFRAGDIVTTWNGTEIDDRTLQSMVAQTPVGRTIPIGVWRSGGAHTLTIITAKMPD
jgi:serine protease Do